MPGLEHIAAAIIVVFIGYIEQLIRSGEFDGFSEELLFNFLVP